MKRAFVVYVVLLSFSLVERRGRVKMCKGYTIELHEFIFPNHMVDTIWVCMRLPLVYSLCVFTNN